MILFPISSISFILRSPLRNGLEIIGPPMRGVRTSTGACCTGTAASAGGAAGFAGGPPLAGGAGSGNVRYQL